MSSLYEQYLPPRAQEMVSVIGIAPFQRLVAWRGGVYLYIPLTISADSELATVIGITAAQKLVAHYSGETLDIPKCDASLRALRNIEIRRRRNSGEQEKNVALDVGLTARHVRKINASNNDNDRQDDLFK